MKEKRSNLKEDLLVVPPFLKGSTCDELNILIELISKKDCIDEQVSIIKTISLIQSPEKLPALCMLYLICPYKHPAKKRISRILSSKQAPVDLYVKNVQESIQRIVPNDKELKYFRYAINTCFDSFMSGPRAVQNCMDDILKVVPDHLLYLNSKISNSNSNIKNLIEELHDYSRAVICLVTLCLAKNIQIPISIFDATLLIIRNASVTMKTKCNFGKIIIHFAKQHNDLGLTEITHKLLTLPLIHEEIWPNVKFTSIDEKLSITIGILNTLSVHELYQITYNQEPLILSLGKFLFEMADTSCALLKTEELFVVCRGITIISIKCYQLMEEKYLKFFQMFIKFILIHLEHYISMIRRNAKLIFLHLVRSTVQSEQIGQKLILNELMKEVFEMWNNNEVEFYSCLSIISKEVSCSILLDHDKDLPLKLLNRVNSDSTYCHQIRITCIRLLKKHSVEIDTDSWRKLWIDPLVDKIIQQNIFDDDHISLLQEAISIKPELSIKIIENYKNDWKHPDLILICAKIARKFEISNNKNVKLDNKKWKGIVDVEFLESVFCHASPTTRLTAIGVIADTRKTTEIFSEIDFKLIIKFLETNLNCPDQAIREKIFAFYKKIFTRIKDSYFVLQRKVNDIERKVAFIDPKNAIEESVARKLKVLELEKEKTSNLIEVYKNFNTEIRDMLLKHNLTVGANYYRRNSTLEMYTLLKSILDDVLPYNLWCEVKADHLITCLYDGYEHNKKLAHGILADVPLEHILKSSGLNLDQIIDICLRLAASKKPTDCITGAYLLDCALHYTETCDVLKLRMQNDNDNAYYLAVTMILIELRREVVIGKENLVTAAGTSPFYGCIFILRFLYQQAQIKNLVSNEIWSNIIKEMINICFEITDLVLPIVNNQSPEGYLPDDFDENNDLIITPQMILLCAWRSIKEISLLFGEIVTCTQILNDNNGIGTITEDQIIQIGDYFFSVLATTKHRGAFEQTYVGFIQLCKRLWRETSGKLADLPRNWIKQLLTDITCETNTKLCATRRSAGLPFMIQALESTALKVLGTADLFNECMKTLLDISEKYRNDVNTKPCTHSMNILRAIYRHSHLGERSVQFIAEGIIVALRGIEGKTWDLRNAGSLLFSTLITRIFGVLRSKNGEDLSLHNRMTIHVFFSRFPNLYDFFLEELRIATSSLHDNTLKLSLYPILLLLSRLYPSIIEESESQYQQISAFLPYLRECCKNRVYKTRMLAAKAIVPLNDKSNLSTYFKELVNEIICSNVSTNYCHGMLLQMLYILKSLPAKDRQIENVWKHILKTEWILLNESYILKDIYNEILIELLTKSFIDNEKKSFLLRAVQILNMPSSSVEVKLGYHNYQLSNTKLNFNLQVLYTQNEIQIALPSILSKALTQSQNVFSFTLDCILYLLFEKSYLFQGIELDSELQFLHEYKINRNELRDNILNDTVFYDVFKKQLNANNDNTCRTKLFFLLSIYTDKIHTFFDLTETDAIERLIDLCSTEYELFYCYSLNCVSELITKVLTDNICLNENILNKLSTCLYKNALPEKSYKTRRAVAELLIKNPQLYKDTKNRNISDNDLCLIWITIQLLGNDFDETIRQRMTNIVTYDSMSHPLLFESVRDIIFDMSVQTLLARSLSICTAYLLFWVARFTSADDFGEDCDNEMLVFEKGDMNLYIEDIHLAKLAISSLKNTVFTMIEQKTPIEYVKEILSSEDLVKWLPFESKLGRTLILNYITSSNTENTFQTDIFKSDLLRHKMNLLVTMLENV